jgi:uncharacterized protein involved in outer membrane biogenesis
MTNPTSSPPRKRSSWLRKLLFVFGGLLLLLVVAYFVVTSSAFFKGVILPRASKAVGGQITVADASISPFSQVYLRQLKVQTTGTEPLLQAEEIRLRYSLFSILRGTMKVDEITVVSPVIQVIENADGTSNLDPLLKKEKKVEKPASKPSAPSGKPPQIDLKNFALKNAIVRRVKNLKDGGREVTELSGVNITLDQLKNGQSSKLTMAAAFKMTRPTNDVLEAKSAGQIEFTLGANLLPQVLKAKVEQEVLRAEGSLRELAGHRTTLTGDVTPTEVKEFSLRFLRGEQLLGEVKVTGPLDLSKKEGRLKLEVASIDRQVLNLIGAPLGIDFGATTLNSTNEISLTQGGSVIAANSRFNAAKFSLTQKGQTTPPLDLQVACIVTVNTADKTALLQTLTLNGTQNQEQLLRGSLTQPMNLAWGNAANAAGDSAFDLTVTDFNFADWKAVLGDSVSAGKLSLDLNVLSQQGGRQLKLGLTSQIADLSMRLGATHLTQAALALKLNGQVNDFKKINLGNYRLDLTRQAQPALTVSGSGGYDGAAFNMQTQIEAVMARLLGSGPVTPLTVGVKLDGTFTNQALDLSQLRLAFAPTQRAPKNELNITGHFDLSTPTTKGRLSIKADTFDVTQLYDAFAGEKSSSPVPAGAPTQPAPASSSPGNVEPDPVNLSLQFTAEANLGQVYLHEIAITNWQTTAKVDGSKIMLDPCRLILNGAPVNASVDLNLGVKGYIYALSLLMDKVPLEPIANSFSPANRGKYQGLILANAKIKGAGVTGASLQKSLSGQVSFTFTNANLQLIGPKTKKLVVPIATLLRVPEITQSPLNWLDAQTELGGGNIKLSRFTIQSEAFEARTQGSIPIAEVLTNSPLNLPVEFALRRSLAEKSSLLPPNTPTNATYALLPKFVTVKGTLGEPKSDLNELALGGLLLKSGVGIAEKLGVKVDPKAGNVLQGVGNLLTGQQPAATNQPSTNTAPKLNPLDLFKKK